MLNNEVGTMKIQGVVNPIKAYATQMGVKSKADRAAFVGTSTDTLDISHKAREIQTFRSKLAGISVVRQDLVSDLKKRIQEGNYEPGGDKIAAAILDERARDNQALNGDSSV